MYITVLRTWLPLYVSPYVSRVEKINQQTTHGKNSSYRYDTGHRKYITIQIYVIE